MLACFDVLADGYQQMLLDVVERCLQKRIARILDSVSDPRLEV